MKEENKRTISLHFDDDEIICRLPNGDLYLKEGVKRTRNYSLVENEIPDENINYHIVTSNKGRETMKRYTDHQPNEDQVDNWETI